MSLAPHSRHVVAPSLRVHLWNAADCAAGTCTSDVTWSGGSLAIQWNAYLGAFTATYMLYVTSSQPSMVNEFVFETLLYQVTLP